MILEELGWNLERAAMFTSCADRGFVPARVARQDRAGYAVWSNDGLFPAVLAGRLRYKLADDRRGRVTDRAFRRREAGARVPWDRSRSSGPGG